MVSKIHLLLLLFLQEDSYMLATAISVLDYLVLARVLVLCLKVIHFRFQLTLLFLDPEIKVNEDCGFQKTHFTNLWSGYYRSLCSIDQPFFVMG